MAILLHTGHFTEPFNSKRSKNQNSTKMPVLPKSFHLNGRTVGFVHRLKVRTTLHVSIIDLVSEKGLNTLQIQKVKQI